MTTPAPQLYGPHDIVVFPLIEPDWPEVRTVYIDGIATGHATFEADPPATWAAFDASRHPDHRLVARDERGTLLGWVAVSPVSSRPVYAGVVEHSLYVAPGARGRGVGRRLLDELVAATEDSGIWTIQSSLFPENLASVALHRAAGFREVGRRERIALMTYGPLAGQWRDTVLIERRSPVAGTAASSAR
ncbi:GNAT family N-acetyltransferase [Kineococcus sp. NBC_00420]|uniref:GNAT family N-acetyltransferase n=1 Tax=Kineococcus sp. NBC_00420 TaxID=2903564 RepID=UPI002E1AAE9E